MCFATATDQINVAILSSVLTIIGGVFIVSFTEILKNIYLKPLNKLNEHLGTIIDRVIFYSAHLTNYSDDKESIIAMSSNLRSASSQLRAKAQALKLYGLWSFFRLVPTKDSIEIIAMELMGLSNSFPTLDNRRDNDYIDQNLKSMEKISKELKFKLH